MKEEIETTHFAVLGKNHVAEPLLTKQVEVCAFHHNLSHGFYRVMSVKFLFSSFLFFLSFLLPSNYYAQSCQGHIKNCKEFSPTERSFQVLAVAEGVVWFGEVRYYGSTIF